MNLPAHRPTSTPVASLRGAASGFAPLARAALVVLTAALAVTACESPQSDERAVRKSGDGPTVRNQIGAATGSSALPSGPTPENDTERRLAIYASNLDGAGPLRATLETDAGDVSCVLFADRATGPVAQFVGLATGQLAWRHPESGTTREEEPLYRDLPFVRAIPEFLVQTGDPTGSGDGGPGFRVAATFHPELRHDEPGTLGMVADPPNRVGSQFYVTLRKAPHLDRRHPVIGRCDNLEVLRRLARAAPSSDATPRGEKEERSDAPRPRLRRVRVSGSWHPDEADRRADGDAAKN